MTPRKIEIDFTIPIDVWADENRGVIMDSIYSNVFDFIQSKDDDRIILQIVPILTKKSRMRIPAEPPVKVDFIISKENIDFVYAEAKKRESYLENGYIYQYTDVLLDEHRMYLLSKGIIINTK